MSRTHTPKAVLTALFALGLATPGCNRDDEVNAALDQLDTTTTEMIKQLKSADDPKAGVDAAQAYLDGHKGEITSKMKEIEDIRGFQVSDETQARMLTSMIDNSAKVETLRIDYLGQTMDDEELEQKLDELIDEYGDVVTASL